VDESNDIKKAGSTKKAKFVDNRSLCDEVNKLIAKWAFMYRVPSSAIDSQEFRDIIFALNPEMYKLPDKQSLSGSLIDAVYQQTFAQVAEHFSKAEGLHLRIPTAAATAPHAGSEGVADGEDAHHTQNAMVEIYDGRGTFFYRPVSSLSRRTNTHALRVVEAMGPVADLKNSNVVTILPSGQEHTEERNGHLGSVMQAIESVYPRKTLLTNEPFSPLACADLMLSKIPAVHQAVTHAQCILQYLEVSGGPGAIVRNLLASVGELRSLGPGFLKRLELPGTVRVYPTHVLGSGRQ
jgi:hypothetical protein